MLSKFLINFPQLGELRRTRNPHPSPPFSIGVFFCFLQVAGTVAQHSKEGVGDGELYFTLFTLAKHQRGPLGQSVLTNVVADFCCTVV